MSHKDLFPRETEKTKRNDALKENEYQRNRKKRISLFRFNKKEKNSGFLSKFLAIFTR